MTERTITLDEIRKIINSNTGVNIPESACVKIVHEHTNVVYIPCCYADGIHVSFEWPEEQT